MELLLQRKPSEGTWTHGDLFVDDVWKCFTLEDVVRERKIHGQTAIPAGRYRVTLENSPRFGRDTLTINNVPDFSGVRIHGGNTDKDTEGCPLVGTQRHESGISNCKPALDSLKGDVKRALTNGETVWLQIENAS